MAAAAAATAASEVAVATVNTCHQAAVTCVGAAADAAAGIRTLDDVAVGILTSAEVGEAPAAAAEETASLTARRNQQCRSDTGLTNRKTTKASRRRLRRQEMERQRGQARPGDD